jgi:3-methyladenine DNA glycosylase Tag
MNASKSPAERIPAYVIVDSQDPDRITPFWCELLKRRGFRFVGPTTLYALMQACGLVDDHLVDCAARPAVEVARRAAGLGQSEFTR